MSITFKISEINNKEKRDYVISNLRKRITFLHDICCDMDNYESNRWAKAEHLMNVSYSRLWWLYEWGITRDYMDGFLVESIQNIKTGARTYTKGPYFYIKMMENGR